MYENRNTVTPRTKQGLYTITDSEKLAKFYGQDLYTLSYENYAGVLQRPTITIRKKQCLDIFYHFLYEIFFEGKHLPITLQNFFQPKPAVIVSRLKVAKMLEVSGVTVEFLFKYNMKQQIIGMRRAINMNTHWVTRAGSILWLTDNGEKFIKDFVEQNKTYLDLDFTK